MSSESNKRDKKEIQGKRGASSPFFSSESNDPLKEGITEDVYVVDKAMEGHRLDYFVSRTLDIGRNRAQILIKEGNVSVMPEQRVKPSLSVREGDRVYIDLPPAEPLKLEPQNVPFKVIYSDSDIIVLDKPAGLVVHPTPHHRDGTLVNGLLYRFPDLASDSGLCRPGIVHRLDRTTSGLMVVVRNGLAQEFLFKDFKNRRVEKQYIALAHGIPPAKEGRITLPIARDPVTRIRMAVVEGGRKSETEYKLLWSLGGYSLLHCILHTGRTHQIRVHLSALKCPLVGDGLYGSLKDSPFEDRRVFLHSWKLAFVHPRTRERVSFRSPLPAELSLFLQEILSTKRGPH